MENEVKIVKVVSWTFPYFGNVHFMPYGILRVTDGTDTKDCKTKGDTIYDDCGYQYITFKRKRYKVVNNGEKLTLVLKK